MSRTPRWPIKLLERFCAPELFDEIVGDLEEMYEGWERDFGASKARRLYIIHTIKFLRPFIFKRKKDRRMTLNYFKIASRNIIRNKAFSVINIIGLSLGLACAIMIYTLVSYHVSFDKFHPNPQRTYRFVTEFTGETVEHWYATPQPLGKAFANDFDYTDKIARVRGYRFVTVSFPEEHDNKKFEEESLIAFADPEFFSMFNLPVVAGSASAIKDPNTALVTRMLARKYFGTDDVLNRVVRVNSDGTVVDFRIVGILEDLPDNTDFRRQLYLSYENLKDYNPYFASDRSWGSFSSSMECFVTLKPGITKEQVEATMPTLINKYYDDIEEKLYRFNLQLVTEMHSDSVYGGRFTDNQFWTLTIIGFLLIVIACINFVNLATAQILNRSKEVGVRKILGSLRSHIFLQFLVETGLIAVAGLIVASVMVYLSLPWVNALLNERLSMRLFSEWQLPAFVFTVLLFVIFAAGMYPALLMTRFQPAAVLKSKFSGSGGLSLRRILIVTQFTVSQLLIISMIVIHNQMEYSMNTDLGFAREAVIMMPIPNGDRMKMKTLGARFMQVPGVYETTKCFEAPGSSSSSSTGARYDNREREEIWEVSLKDADEKYAPTFDLKFVAGRNLLPADSIREFLVNETFVKKLGVASPEEVIGKKLSVNGGTMNGTIEGVVKDFYTQSFHDPIAAICISMNFDRFQYFAVKIDMSQAQSVINEFNRMWDDTYPDNVFGYRFVDDKIAEFYKRDNAVLRLVESVSMIAIVISCLGLYGMVSFMSVRKTKEIGVRKVLGASVTSILWLFAREFAVLIGIAFATAAPLAWLLMNKWLQTFVYHIDISGVSFIFTITGTLAVAAITVGYHSMRSALANPAVSLHSE